MHFKKTALAVTALSFTALVVGTTALPANAGPDGHCGKRFACIYENEDFNIDSTMHYRDFTGDYKDFRQLHWLDYNGSDSNDGMDNETSSIQTGASCSATLWQNVGWTGAHNNWGPGKADGKLSNNDIGDNRASSIRVTCG
jgi:hypothetical protein